METKPVIELLYFEACPSWKKALELLESALAGYEVETELSLVRVETPQEAVQHQFIGSPTIRINGQDLFPVDQGDFALGCRVYPTEEGYRGWPTEKMITEKLAPRFATSGALSES